jgi:ribosome biogenesis GTPase
VQEAIDEGRLPRERLESYRTLQRELRRLAAKQDSRLRAEEKKKRVAFAKSLRKSAW